ncbi:hypothetical protein H2198_006320 [Neophaeococcomyces mojaviensis]|uniref:Uncharacterized protein n=1 Tax=Neophaeococcomyces mojaviensis TaxID=3383035 RepID=A0ACC3A3J4_9EURO|nr:hypothetical protein H2198_006320 [Knufia sp. JES_112]
MPPTNKDATGEDTINMLKEALKSVNGTLDFSRLATKTGAPNAEAARKRFKRFFEKDEEQITMIGSTLGSGNGDLSPKKATATPKTPKTPRTTKTKVAAATPGGDVNSDDADAHAKGSSASKNVPVKKRKANEISTDEEEGAENGDTVVEAETGDDEIIATSIVDAVQVNSEIETPKRKAKTTKATAPKTPKSPKKPAAPKAPKTPKTAKTPKFAADDEEERKLRTENMNEPEKQSIKDSMEKQAGVFGGQNDDGTMGEPEKQAIRDDIAKRVEKAESDAE